MKIVFLLNFLPVYKVPIYERLNAVPGLDVLVIHAPLDREIGKLAVNDTSRLSFSTDTVAFREVRLGPFLIRWLPGALRALRRAAPDVLLLADVRGNLSYWLALAWARRRRKKVLIWGCAHETQKPGTLAHAIKTAAGRLFFRSADKLLVYSSAAKRTLQARYRVPEDRVVICYNGLDIEPLLGREEEIGAAARRLRERESPGGAKVFLFVGGLIAVKRVDLLIRAFARLKGTDAFLWIVGDGPENDALRALHRETGGAVRFFGRIVEEAEPFFAACDFLVLPRLGGLALNQAMFWAKPCLCSVADGTEEDLVLDGRTGFRFSPDDLDALEGALRAACGLDPGRYEAMGAAARRLILERSNVRRITETVHETVRGLAGRVPGGGGAAGGNDQTPLCPPGGMW